MKKLLTILLAILLHPVLGYAQVADTIAANGRTYTQIFDSLSTGLVAARIPQNLPDTTGIVHNKQDGRVAFNNPTNNVFKLYPNPASSQELTIHIDASVINDAVLGNLNLSFYNSVGKLVKVQSMAKNTTQMAIPINHLPNGIYTVVLSTNNQTLAAQKLTIIR
ncbi:MAG: T9SS type A sorting domain-containing protein [Sphingobacteriales bacterium]|nr:T9SS type A sorting domain-containing protein [Sphingobacteriales bacterium]MBK7527075.1 T9SS type A sorting domain-containing protein [Sphingobacteriales bacterium]MBL0247789.1 T9SS type A sorting domain-containing protein [Sphingobacteriales bacterium]MBP9141635.1 T9SS type A sorting domain-containing protein [Chitinophagales bacterium]